MRWSAALPLLLLTACARERPRDELIEGEAAGATFLVKLAGRVDERERAEIESIVGGALERIHSIVSTSGAESDLARLERAVAGSETPVSVETFEMVREAVRVSELTGGAFDVTAAPLARLWGFGPGAPPGAAPPTEEAIARERGRVGFTNIALDDDSIDITKRIESLEIDLSEMATGYALDLAAAALEERGYKDYLIEAGKKVRTRGKDAGGEPWLVPILKPGPGGGEIQRNVPLSGFSMATSGDYRGADEAEALSGKLHTHLVDPRTGRPLDHGLLSVTVLGDTCMTAHALSRGLLVLGPEEGFRLASGENLAALFLIRSESGALQERETPAFAELFGALPRGRARGVSLKYAELSARNTGMTMETPQTTDAWERVHELLEEERLDEALGEAERLVARAPESARAHCLLGMVQAQRGAVETALTSLDQALALDPKLTSARLEKARLFYDEARFEDVIETLRGERSVESLYLAASALYELGEHDEASEVCRQALVLEELPELRHLEALLRLQNAEPAEALAAAQRSIELDPDLPEGHHALGLAQTQLGRIEEADAAFARAAELDPESYIRPFRLNAEDFDEVVDEALAELPEVFEGYLENVEVAVEDVPDKLLVKEGLEFDLLGLYQGGTIQSESWDFPDRVLLFHRNLENISPNRESLIEEIRDTIYHEIGHHMGMDEDAVREAEEGREAEDGPE